MSRQYYDDPYSPTRRVNVQSRRQLPPTPPDYGSNSRFQPIRQSYQVQSPPPPPPVHYPSHYPSYDAYPTSTRQHPVNRVNYPTNNQVQRRYVLETPAAQSRTPQYPPPPIQSHNHNHHHTNQDNYSRHQTNADQYNRRDQPSYPVQSQHRSINVPVVRQTSTSSRPRQRLPMPIQHQQPISLLAQFLQNIFFGTGGLRIPLDDDDDDDDDNYNRRNINRSSGSPVDLITFAWISPDSNAIAIPNALRLQFGDFLELLAHDEPPAVGLSENEIEHIPIKTYRKTSKSKSEEEKCAICLSAYKNDEKVKRLRCKHIFHPDCIDPWLKTSTQCPICRGSQSND